MGLCSIEYVDAAHQKLAQERSVPRPVCCLWWLYRLSHRLCCPSQEADVSVSQATRVLARGCIYAFDAARLGKTAAVTIVSDQTDYPIRQASSTSQTRQSRHVPFVTRHRLPMDESTQQGAPGGVLAVRDARIGSAFCGSRGLRVKSMTSMVAVCAILCRRVV